jgi:hypothetical protein
MITMVLVILASSLPIDSFGFMAKLERPLMMRLSSVWVANWN